MADLIKTDHSGYSVDSKTGAVLNTDELAYMKHKAEREHAIKMQTLEMAVDSLRREVDRLNKLIEEKLK